MAFKSFDSEFSDFLKTLNNLAASITEEVTLLSAKQQTKEVAEA